MNLRRILWCAVAVLIAAGIITSVAKNGKSPAEPQATPAATEQTTKTVTITAVGDCTLATDINAQGDDSFESYAESYGNSYFFENVRDIFSEDDLTIVNLECVLSDRGEREDKSFAFRGKPEYVEILSGSSVEAANMANNHSADYGQDSRIDTKKNLDNAGILNFRGTRVAYTDVNGIKVGLVGINALNDTDKTYLEQAVSDAKANSDLVILSIHWGIEKDTEPTEEQIQLAHTAIDSGADLVLGTHPHVLQGFEKYKDRYIAYSLGNFSFGGNNNPSDKDTVIYRQTFTFSNNVLVPDDNYELIPCTVSSVDGYNDYKPTVATGDRMTAIEEKITGYTQALGDLSLKFRR